jgi:hypothetical protein
MSSASNPGLHEIGGMSNAVFVLNRGDRVATIRCNPRLMIVSSDRTTRQVDQVPHADPVGDFLQFRAAGREEAAHQTIAAELCHPVLPALGAQTQPLEDRGQLCRDRGLARAKDNRTNSSFSLHPSALFSSRFLSHFSRLPSPSPSKNALRTQRDTQ